MTRTRCALPVDSDDEVGASAGAFNRLIGTLARSHQVESAMRDFGAVLSREFEVEGLVSAALDGLLRHTRAEAGAILVAREDRMEPLASHGLRGIDGLAENDHVRRALRLDRTEQLHVEAPDMIVDSLLVGRVAREIAGRRPSRSRRCPSGWSSWPRPGTSSATASSCSSTCGPTSAWPSTTRSPMTGWSASRPWTPSRMPTTGASGSPASARNTRAPSGPRTRWGILMLDIDHFKAVNDTYGHLVGDRILRAVAGACRRVLRDGDVLIRYGGEEFLVLLPGAGPDDVRQVGERIRRAVAETSVADGGQRVGVTVSLGGATYRDASDSTESLVAIADGALYEAKEAGRDRLVVA